ncbi:MAG: thioredoxin-dependent thiol peroxidase [Kiritimatiellae bacterium]|nr:thioredoxin-dependent thiol peroxidase [Kiritimatiellia bacterium]
MATLKTGDNAPSFTLQDASGSTVKLSDFSGHKCLLYFYPKADTPGCTKQSCAIRDAEQPLREANIQGIGISPDTPAKLAKFDKKHHLGFALLSDTDHTVAETYGAWGEKSMCGKTYMGIIRSSFLIDENGLISEAWYKVKPLDTVTNVLDQ